MAEKSIYQEMAGILKSNQQEVLKLWITQIMERAGRVAVLMGDEEIKKFAIDNLEILLSAMPTGADIEGAAYEKMKALNEKLSADMAAKDISPTETALLIFSLKDALLMPLQNAYPNKDQFNDVIGIVNRLVDSLGLFTFAAYVKAREKVIKEQQQAMMELSAPVVKLWDRVLMVPLIGMLDSSRTQLVMETLLTAIEDTQAKVAILDISGIPVVDSLVAKHLIRTVTATRLMGAECIITGIRSRISQTMVQLGVDLTGVVTRTTLADGLKSALDMTGQKIAVK